MKTLHCQLETGFFVLRLCGREAVGECDYCKKVFCHRHSGAAALPNLCLACARSRNLLTDDNDDDLHRRYHRDAHNRPSWRIDNSRGHRHRDDTSTGAAGVAAGMQPETFSAAEAAEFEKTEQQSITDADGDNASDFEIEADDGDISIFDS